MLVVVGSRKPVPGGRYSLWPKVNLGVPPPPSGDFPSSRGGRCSRRRLLRWVGVVRVLWEGNLGECGLRGLGKRGGRFVWIQLVHLCRLSFRDDASASRP